MAYELQPGTIQYRAMAWLRKQPSGTEVTASTWGEAIGVDGTTLSTCIKPAVTAGAVRRRTKDGTQRPLWFMLGDGAPPAPPVSDEEDAHDQLPARTSAPEVQPQPGAMFPGGVRGDEKVPRPRAPAKAAPIPAPAPAPTPAKAPKPAPLPSLKAYVEAIGKDDEQKEAQPPLPFDAWFSGRTGQLYLRGVQLNADGDAILTSDAVRVRLAALSGCAA